MVDIEDVTFTENDYKKLAEAIHEEVSNDNDRDGACIIDGVECESGVSLGAEVIVADGKVTIESASYITINSLGDEIECFCDLDKELLNKVYND